MLKYIIPLLVITGSVNCYSQSGYCIDTTRIFPGSYCYPYFEPVCGCDGNTYRNSCNATQQNGVIDYEGGPCEPVIFDMNPNPVINNLTLDILTKTEGNVKLFIFSLFGKQKYYQNFLYIDRVRLNLSMNDYEHGLYFILVEKDGYYAVKRFVKADN